MQVINESINYIEIGATRNALRPRNWVTQFMPRNEFRGMSEFTQTMDGTRHMSNVDRYFFPCGDFEFNFESPEEYAECKQIMNGDPFVIRYYDPEILMWVIRLVRMTSNSLDLFLSTRDNYLGAINYRFTIESMFAYTSYQDLKDRATDDERF